MRHILGEFFRLVRMIQLSALALVFACALVQPDALGEEGAKTRWSDWSEPVLLGDAVNSPFRELGAGLSPNKLSLYFNSDRPLEGAAQFNIWVSQRACLECPWQPARPLPAPINGMDNGGQATLSRDGHLLFFLSTREGSEPLADGSGLSEDIWMATRGDTHDDFAWENPRRPTDAPGCTGDGRVNTEQNENVRAHVVAAPGGYAHLYFSRGFPAPQIYRVTVDRHGDAVDCAEPVLELGQPAFGPTVGDHGRELIFHAQRLGTLGVADLWVSRRHNVTDPWSPPVNLGRPINSQFPDLNPGLSEDGTTLVFSSGQLRGGLGLQDIWIATRSRRE